MSRRTVRQMLDLEKMPPLSDAQKAELEVLRALPDDEIDTSDIPPLTEAFFATAVRRPLAWRRMSPEGAEQPIPPAQSPIPMTDDEVDAAALKDPDAQPMTDEAMAHMRPVPRSKTLRRVLGLTQEEFAARYQIPIATLRDWEQGTTEPDQPARAYLRAIAGDPEAVERALQALKQLASSAG